METNHPPPATQMLTAVVAQDQIDAARSSRTRQNDKDFTVLLNPFAFGIVWIAIAMMHILCIGCFGIQSWVYKQIPLASFASALEQYDVTMPPSNFHAVSIAYLAVAIVHCLQLLEMLVSSIWHRNLAFVIRPRRQRRSHRPIHNSRYLSPKAFAKEIIHMANLVIGERGFLGVKGRHFAIIYVAREIFETILQSILAFRMSQFVPRLMVNRFFVFTIVTNCWSTPVIHYLFEHNPPLERMICLVFDIGLDFTSTVGVPVVLAIPYWKQYDFEETNFPYELYWNDFWFVNMINELRIVFVSSWSNLITELAFTISLVICLQDVKYLLRPNSTATSEKNPPKWKCFHNSVKPIPIKIHIKKNNGDQSVTKLKPIQLVTGTNSQYQVAQVGENNQDRNAIQFQELSSRLVRIVHAFMIVWGLLLLVLHLHASSRPSPAHCAQKSWPWFGSKSGCTLLRVDCNKSMGSIANYSELDAVMATLDVQTLTYIVIRHCPFVEIPGRIQSFPNLVGLKIYDSTIARWDAEASITTTHHPKMVFLFVVKSNMTQIPLGLLSPEFPPKIKDIEFAWTNLTTLPDDLGDIWPTDGFIMLERGQFTSVPQVLLRRQNFQISLAGGILTALEENVFTNPLGTYIWASGNPITELPPTLVPSKSIWYMDFCNTKLKSLPSWMDAEFLQNSFLVAGGTPLCDNLDPIIASGDKSLVTLDLAVAWDAYQMGRFSCWMSGSYFYPYDAEAQQ